MFKSYTAYSNIVRINGMNDHKSSILPNGRRLYEYTVIITDSEFVEQAIGLGDSEYHEEDGDHAADALIKIYSSKNLNVAHNLFLLCLYLKDKNNITLNDYYDIFDSLLESFQPYRDQLKEYINRYNNMKVFW